MQCVLQAYGELFPAEVGEELFTSFEQRPSDEDGAGTQPLRWMSVF